MCSSGLPPAVVMSKPTEPVDPEKKSIAPGCARDSFGPGAMVTDSTSDFSTSPCSPELRVQPAAAGCATTPYRGPANASSLLRLRLTRTILGAYGSTSTVAPSRPTLKRSEEHTSELQSLRHLVCRLLLEKKWKETGWGLPNSSCTPTCL